MATVNQLGLELAAFEADLKSALDGDKTARATLQAGAVMASLAAGQCLLDLGIKGVLPEGRVGKIMNAVRDAIEESTARIVA